MMLNFNLSNNSPRFCSFISGPYTFQSISQAIIRSNKTKIGAFGKYELFSVHIIKGRSDMLPLYYGWFMLLWDDWSSLQDTRRFAANYRVDGRQAELRVPRYTTTDIYRLRLLSHCLAEIFIYLLLCVLYIRKNYIEWCGWKNVNTTDSSGNSLVPVGVRGSPAWCGFFSFIRV